MVLKTALPLFCCLSLALSGCFEKRKVLDISEAENLLFLTDGRLIVTTGSGLFEITQQADGQYRKESVSDYQCVYQGVTQLQDFVFTVCNFETELGNTLLWADSREENLSFRPFLKLDGMLQPNGLATNGKDTIYIANSPYILQGSIGRLRLDPEQLQKQDFLNADILESIVEFEPKWRHAHHGVYNSNGLRFLNDQLYFTDLGTLKKIGLTDEDKATRLFSRLTILDDILPYCGGILVTDFFAGQVLFLSEEGDVLHYSPLGKFPGASSLMVGVGSGFTQKQLLVTERGLLLKPNSKIGNQLSVVELENEAVLNECI